MKAKYFIMLAVMFFFSMNMFAQTYPEVTIMDIQYQDPDSLLLYGDLPSPLVGDTVTITGIVQVAPYRASTIDSGVVIRAGVPAVYLQDTLETDFGGILVRDLTSSIYFAKLDTGQVIKVSGVVTNYFVTTQFDILSFGEEGVIDFKEKKQPVLITLDSLAQIGTNLGKVSGEKWEGVYVEVRNITVGSNSIGAGSFSIFDANNTEVLTGNQSSYFYTTYTPPQPGTVLEYVRGYIQNRDNLSQGYAHIICPMYPGDVKISSFPPNIDDITRDPLFVAPGQNVTVTATISDPDGTVASAKLYWRKNSGTNEEVAMINISDSTYQAIIPSQPDSCVVDYFLTATDNQDHLAITPSDTSRNRYFYLVLDRPLTIQDVQYNPFGGVYSAYNNYEVTVTGIVTADTSDIPLGPVVVIQNGIGPWSGIRINGTETIKLKKGDDVTVTGTVLENFSVTNITGMNSSANIVVNSTGNPLPAPQSLSTSDINFKPSGTVSAEQWECVLVKYSDVAVTDENADGVPGPNVTGYPNYGEILVADASSVNTRVELQDGNHQYHNFWDATLELVPIRVLVGDMMDELVGIMYYSFGNYKLFPRTNDDFVNYTTDIENDIKTVYNYKLDQNYPNPFNPSTKINYSIQAEGLVTLKVYNIIGQSVATLVNEFKTAGAHTVNFDATKLSSGIYLYKIDSNGFTQTKKMMLVK